MRRTFVFIILAFVIGFISGTVAAQDIEDTDRVAVKAGEHRDLTFWRKLKLGAAPFVNPELLKKASVAHVYDNIDPEGWYTLSEVEALVGLWVDGEAGIARYDSVNGSYEVLNREQTIEAVAPELAASSAFVDSYVASVIIAMKAYGKLHASGSFSEEYRIVTEIDHLAGRRANGAIVSWDAQVAVNEVVPQR